MKDILIILVGCFGILYSGRYAYWSWFQSKKYVVMTQKQRIKYRKTLWFMPQAVTFNFLDKNPVFEIWSIRIASLLVMAICIFWMVAGIYGPL